MKIKDNLVHTVDIVNEDNEVTTIKISAGDMLQMNNIAILFKTFEKLKDIKFTQTDDFDELLKQVQESATVIEEVNDALDRAFGTEVREKAFKGSSSIELYYAFFSQLDVELEKAGVKVKKYVKELRRKELINKGKENKDTI